MECMMDGRCCNIVKDSQSIVSTDSRPYRNAIGLVRILYQLYRTNKCLEPIESHLLNLN